MHDTLNTEEAAKVLKCSKQFVCELARRGELPAVQLGGQWLFVKLQLLDWLSAKAFDEQARRREQSFHVAKTAGDELVKKRERGRPRNAKIIDIPSINGSDSERGVA